MPVFPDALYALYDERYIKRDGSNSITGDIIPDTDGVRSLGSSAKKWYKIWSSRAAIDTIESDIVPDGDGTRSLGSVIKKWINGYFNQITLNGVTRTTWPDAGSGSQSMDDVYNNGSVVNVDNTDVKYKLSSGKSFKITDAGETETYLGVSQTDVRLKDCGNQKELIWYSVYGDEVTTTKTQALSNKTFTSPIVNGVVSGGVSSSSGMILSDLMQTARETIELIDYTP